MALFGRKQQADSVKKDAEDTAPVELPAPPQADELGRRSVQDHQNYLLSMVSPLSPFGVQLLEAWGRPVCENLTALSELPAQDSAHYTGYAVSSLDLIRARLGDPAVFEVVEESVAPLKVGEASVVLAGRPLPPGADVVIPMDRVQLTGKYLSVETPFQSGEGVLVKGSDVAVGDPLMSVNERIGARQIGLLASLGIDKVLARPRPRVVVISIGRNIVSPGMRLENPLESFDACSYMLAAAARSVGGQVWRVSIKSNDLDEIRSTISDQLIRADIIVTTGGLEPGLSEVLQSVGPKLGPCDFTELAMSPAQRHGVGLIGDEQVPIVMLPSDPVAAYTGFALFLVPMLRKFSGIDPAVPETIRCYAATILRSMPGKSHFIRGNYSDRGGRRFVRPAGSDSQNLLSDLSQANCIIGLGADVTTVEAGDPVMVLPLTDD